MVQMNPDLRTAQSGKTGGPGSHNHMPPGFPIMLALLILATGPFGIILAAVVGLIYFVYRQSQKRERTERPQAHDCGDCPEHIVDRLESDEHPDLLDTLSDLVDRVRDGRNEDASPERFHSGEVYDVPLDQSRYDAAPGHTKKERLEQLETLRKAGLFTDEEYRTRKARIMKEP